MPGAAGFTAPYGINPQGDIVGTYFDVLENIIVSRGFLLRKGTFTNIDVDLPGSGSGKSDYRRLTSRYASLPEMQYSIVVIQVSWSYLYHK